jgi:hypothetical protein
MAGVVMKPLPRTWNPVGPRFSCTELMSNSFRYLALQATAITICTLTRRFMYGFRTVLANSINQLIFLMETQCVFWEMRTGFININLCRCRGIWVLFPVGYTRVRHSIETGSGARTASYAMGTGSAFPRRLS